MRRFFGFVWPWLMAPLFWIVVVVLCVMCSCRSMEYVPVEVIKTDTTYINKIQRDSIYQFDSFYIRDKGDTVLITKTRYLYRDKLIRDTVYMSRIDSVQVPYPIERKLTRWEHLKLELGGWTFVIIITASLIFIIWIVHKFIRKY